MRARRILPPSLWCAVALLAASVVAHAEPKGPALGAATLVVGTRAEPKNLNPIASEDDFKLLLDRIARLRGRREYFNLAA